MGIVLASPPKATSAGRTRPPVAVACKVACPSPSPILIEESDTCSSPTYILAQYWFGAPIFLPLKVYWGLPVLGENPACVLKYPLLGIRTSPLYWTSAAVIAFGNKFFVIKPNSFWTNDVVATVMLLVFLGAVVAVRTPEKFAGPARSAFKSNNGFV